MTKSTERKKRCDGVETREAILAAAEDESVAKILFFVDGGDLSTKEER